MNLCAVANIEKVCRDAQKVVKEHYQQIWLAVLGRIDLSPRGSSDADYYVDTIDIFYFSYSNMKLVASFTPDFEIRNIAISVKNAFLCKFNHGLLGIDDLCTRDMRSLKKVMFVGDREEVPKGA